MLDVFVTGTDSGVGKTIISAGLAIIMQSLGYTACIHKPIQTGGENKNGFLQAPDIAYIKKLDPFIVTDATYVFVEKTTPVIASEMENNPVNPYIIKRNYEKLKRNAEVIITDTEGGLFTPIGVNMSMIDIAKQLNQPVLVVVTAEADMVNKAILNINAAKSYGLDIAGVIINKFPIYTVDSCLNSAHRLIEEYSDAKVVGIVPDFGYNTITAGLLIDNILNNVDIEALFKIKIPKLSNIQ